MDLFFLILSFLMMILGIIGCFFPIIPGPLTGWFGFLILYQIENINTNKSLLIITLSIALSVFIIDYLMPIIGAKLFGGSKKGIIGACSGLIIGIVFLGPFGLLIGSFVGALTGEILNDNKSFKIAFKASMGTLLGLISGFFLKISVSTIFFLIYIFEIWKIRSMIF
jgi:hypothetical protein